MARRRIRAIEGAKDTGIGTNFLIINFIKETHIYSIFYLTFLRSSSPSSSVNKASEEGPPPEDEPTWDVEQVLLDWYNSDLNLTISKTDFMSAAPLTDGGFAYMWAGVRATYGFLSGKLCYEVKVNFT